jgi:hypothetical protein
MFHPRLYLKENKEYNYHPNDKKFRHQYGVKEVRHQSSVKELKRQPDVKELKCQADVKELKLQTVVKEFNYQLVNYLRYQPDLVGKIRRGLEEKDICYANDIIVAIKMKAANSPVRPLYDKDKNPNPFTDINNDLGILYYHMDGVQFDMICHVCYKDVWYYAFITCSSCRTNLDNIEFNEDLHIYVNPSFTHIYWLAMNKQQRITYISNTL